MAERAGTYTEATDEVPARVRKGHQWFFTGRIDAEAQLAGVTGFDLSETLWLMVQMGRWPQSAVDEYLRGYHSVIKEGA